MIDTGCAECGAPAGPLDGPLCGDCDTDHPTTSAGATVSTLAIVVPAGAYVARVANGARMAVLGLDRHGDALVLDAGGRLVRAVDVSGFVEVTAPDPAVPQAPRTERAAPVARRTPPEPEPEEPDVPRENPVRALRRAQGLPWRGDSA